MAKIIEYFRNNARFNDAVRRYRDINYSFKEKINNYEQDDDKFIELFDNMSNEIHQLILTIESISGMSDIVLDNLHICLNTLEEASDDARNIGLHFDYDICDNLFKAYLASEKRLKQEIATVNKSIAAMNSFNEINKHSSIFKEGADNNRKKIKHNLITMLVFSALALKFAIFLFLFHYFGSLDVSVLGIFSTLTIFSILAFLISYFARSSSIEKNIYSMNMQKHHILESLPVILNSVQETKDKDEILNMILVEFTKTICDIKDSGYIKGQQIKNPLSQVIKIGENIAKTNKN